MKKRYLSILFLLLVISCKQTIILAPDEESLLLTAEETSIVREGFTTLTCIGAPSGSFKEWSCTGGKFITNDITDYVLKNSIRWQAPKTSGTYTISVTIEKNLKKITTSKNITVN